MVGHSITATLRTATAALAMLVVSIAAACSGGDSQERPFSDPRATATPTPPATGEVLEGVFETGFEHSAFYPGVNCPSGGAAWWLAWLLELDFAQRIIDETGQDPFAELTVSVFRVRIRGEVSPLGQYGHLGQYMREVVVHEVLTAETAEDCDDGRAASELRLARERWRSVGPDSYELRFQRHCECSPEWAGPIDVEVRNAMVVEARYMGEPAQDGTAITIEDLFDAIDRALASGVKTSVSYDADLGNPVTVQLDLDALAVDGGLSLVVLELLPLDDRTN